MELEFEWTKKKNFDMGFGWSIMARALRTIGV